MVSRRVRDDLQGVPRGRRHRAVPPGPGHVRQRQHGRNESPRAHKQHRRSVETQETAHDKQIHRAAQKSAPLRADRRQLLRRRDHIAPRERRGRKLDRDEHNPARNVSGIGT